MFPDETRRRQERLSEIIYLLSELVFDSNGNDQLEIIQELHMIYKDGFKHSYSDLFPVILNILDEENQYSTEFLTNNLNSIREILEVDYSNGKHEYNDIYAQFTKLCDHLNLQISELTVFWKVRSMEKDMKVYMDTVDDKLNHVTNEISLADKKLDEANKGLVTATKKADSLQTELIAVLSIFAAIVITFSGGFTFLGSVMTSIKDVKYIEGVVLATLVCGIVIFNTIFLLMYLVSKITERNIFAKCEKEQCPYKSDEDKCKCSGLKKIRKRLPYVFYYNLISTVGIALDMSIWYLDIKNIFF